MIFALRIIEKKKELHLIPNLFTTTNMFIQKKKELQETKKNLKHEIKILIHLTTHIQIFTYVMLSSNLNYSISILNYWPKVKCIFE